MTSVRRGGVSTDNERHRCPAVATRGTSMSSAPSAVPPSTQISPTRAGAPGRQSLKTRILDGELGGYLLLAPAVVVMLALTIWPLLFSVGISLTDYHLGSTATTHFIGFRNYSDIFNDSIFLGSLSITGQFLLLGVPLQLVLGYICARILVAAHVLPGARILRTIFIIPTMMTPLAVALFWGFILDPMLGVGNWLLSLVHVPGQPWLASPNLVVFTLTGLYLWQWVPFTAVLLMAGLMTIPQSIYEAAALDGVPWHQRVLHLDLPLLLRVGAIAAILAVVEIIRLFDLIYGSTQGGPGTASLTNAMEIYRIGFLNFNTGTAAAASLLILVVTILISQGFVRLLREETVQ
jgi:multiple sugar transport system permease protein